VSSGLLKAAKLHAGINEKNRTDFYKVRESICGETSFEVYLVLYSIQCGSILWFDSVVREMGRPVAVVFSSSFGLAHRLVIDNTPAPRR
jgi:hypothetical protein